jgi:hypothetical protein
MCANRGTTLQCRRRWQRRRVYKMRAQLYRRRRGGLTASPALTKTVQAYEQVLRHCATVCAALRSDNALETDLAAIK